MRYASLVIAALVLPQTACAQEGQPDSPPGDARPASDEEIFTAAGFELSEGKWRKCGDPGTMSYEPGRIAERGDFNGDGQPDAIVMEGGSYCFGMTGYGYTLVSRAQDRSWRVLDDGIGIPRFLDTRGEQGWPDIEVGGPGFCFPVLRWNGGEYALNRNEYEGASCQP